MLHTLWVGEIEWKIGKLRQNVIPVGRVIEIVVHWSVYVLDEHCAILVRVAEFNMLEVLAIEFYHCLVGLGLDILDSMEILHHLDELERMPLAKILFLPNLLAMGIIPFGLVHRVVETEHTHLMQ
jgi:hypothetical protein